MLQPASIEGPLRRRVRIGDLLLDAVNLTEALRVCEGAAQNGGQVQVATVSLHFLSKARSDPRFAEVVNDADLVVADGMPVVWLSRLMGAPLPERITGHDLVHGFADLAARRGYSVFFLGATPELADKAASTLRHRHPGLRVAGAYAGAFTEGGLGLTQADEDGAVDSIKAARPEFLFVALGCPKQEFWIQRHMKAVGVPVCIGVGSVLDVLGGRVSRAPVWAQQAGMEWAVRLVQEPRRLWKRYLLQDLPTAARIGAGAIWKRV